MESEERAFDEGGMGNQGCEDGRECYRYLVMVALAMVPVRRRLRRLSPLHANEIHAERLASRIPEAARY